MHPSDPDADAATSAPQVADRLLPLDAYPEQLDENNRNRVDARLRELAHLVPRRPGRYVDREGDPWVRDDDGSWTDCHGVRRGSAYSPLLGMFAPWRRTESTEE